MTDLRERLRAEGKRVVLTNGFFDPFNNTHFKVLNEAKEKGDILIVGLNSDQSIKTIKNQPPVLNQGERNQIIGSIDLVDFIVLYDEPNAERLIETVKPDVYVKGGNHSLESINQQERSSLEKMEARIEFVGKMMDESQQLRENIGLHSHQIDQFSDELIKAFKAGKKVLVCGNGGSASDAQHFQAELIGRFKKNRAGLPCIALTQHPSLLTALANDFGYESVFEKQVEALGQGGDVLVALSTSGNSPNIIRALQAARKNGMKAIGLSGNKGGLMNEHTDLNIVVDSNNSARIQETHITIIHLVSEIVEKGMFPEE